MRGGQELRGEAAPAQGHQVRVAEAPGEPHGGAGRQEGVAASEHLLTARACAMVEAVRAVYSYDTREEAAAELDRALPWMTHSNVPLMRVAARTIRDEREGVLNWFSVRTTRGFLEEMNSVIQSLKRASRGFRNVGYFTTMIFLRLGRLDFSAQLASARATH